MLRVSVRGLTEETSEGFPGDSEVKNPPAIAADTSPIPDLEIPHAVKQLNCCTTTAEHAR